MLWRMAGKHEEQKREEVGEKEERGEKEVGGMTENARRIVWRNGVTIGKWGESGENGSKNG